MKNFVIVLMVVSAVGLLIFDKDVYALQDKISKKDYIERLEQLHDCCSDEVSRIGSNDITLVFWQMSDDQFETFMKLNPAELMMAAKSFGAPEPEQRKAKRMYVKLSPDGYIAQKFNEYVHNSVNDVKMITKEVPDQYSDHRKSMEIEKARKVMVRLERFLACFDDTPLPFKTKLSDYGFSTQDRKQVEDYYVKYSKE